MWPAGRDIRVGDLVEIISDKSFGLIISQDEVYGFMWNVLIGTKKFSVHASRIRRV